MRKPRKKVRDFADFSLFSRYFADFSLFCDETTILCVPVIQQLVKALNHLTIAWRVLRACCIRVACVIKSRIVTSRGASRATRQCRGDPSAARVGGRPPIARRG